MEEFRIPEDVPASYEDDIRPAESPYAGPTVTVYFKTGDAFHIPRTIWSRCPELAAKRQQVIERKADIFGRPGQMSDIPIAVGHVLVNYLFTENYECLRPSDASYKDKISSELRTAVQVACASQVYNLPGLGRLANAEIKRLGDELDILHLIEIFDETNQPPVHLPGVSDYLQSRLFSLCDDLTSTAADDLLIGLDAPTKTSQILLKSIILFQIRSLNRSAENIQTKDTGGAMEVSEDTDSKNSRSEEVAEFFRCLMNRSSIPKKQIKEEISEEAPAKDAEPAAEDEYLSEVSDVDELENEARFQCEKVTDDAPAEAIAIEDTTSEFIDVLAYQPALGVLKKVKGSKKKAKRPIREEEYKYDEPAEAKAVGAAASEKEYSESAESAEIADFAEDAKACQNVKPALKSLYFEESVAPADDFYVVSPSIVDDFGFDDICPTCSMHLTVYGGWKTCAGCGKLVQRFSLDL